MERLEFPNEFPFLNIRGVGELYKVDWACRLKVKYNIGFINLQETRELEVVDIDIANYWGDGNFESNRKIWWYA